MQIRCATCGRGVQIADTGVLPPTCPHCKRPPVPERLGRYRIVKLLAAGGMGEVYLGEHEDLATRVAIKLLPVPPGDDPGELRARFWREARLTAAIDHPGVVQVLDLREEEGRLYLVLELVAGRSLRSLLREGPIDAREARRLALAVADVVAAAHAQGVVHRDIKPENVMVMPDGAVRVLDFGLARAMQDQEPLTRTGEILGTPEYMAPEQLLDAAEATTTPTDVHALGVLTYELLTGRSPFAGQSMFQALKLVESLTPPPPSRQRDEGGESGALPDDVDRVVLGALAKDAADRPADAAAFAAALRAAWPDGDSRAAGGAQGNPDRRGAWIAAVCTSLALAAGLAVGRWSAGGDADAPPPRPAAVPDAAAEARVALDLAAAEPWTDPGDATRAARRLDAFTGPGGIPDLARAPDADPAHEEAGAQHRETAAFAARLALRLGQPHRALPALEAAVIDGAPGARGRAAAAWFAAHAALPMALELPPWFCQVDVGRRDRLLGEPADPETDRELAAWQRFAAGEVDAAWTIARRVEPMTPEGALLLAFCANRLCDLPARRRDLLGAQIAGFEPPLVRALLDGPTAARAIFGELGRTAPPWFADRWLFELATTAHEAIGDAERLPRLEALAEQAWLAGAGEQAVLWNAGLQWLVAPGRARAERALALLAPMDLADAPGGVMATIGWLASTEGVRGIDALLRDAPAAAEAVPFVGFWQGLQGPARNLVVQTLNGRPPDAPPEGPATATLRALAAVLPGADPALWPARSNGNVDTAVLAAVSWVDADRAQALLAAAAANGGGAPALSAVALAARAGVDVSDELVTAHLEDLCRVPR